MSKKKPVDTDNQRLATLEAEDQEIIAALDLTTSEPAAVREGVCADHFHHSHGHLEETLGLKATVKDVGCNGPGKCAPCTLHREIITSRQQGLAEPCTPWVGPDGRQYGQQAIDEAKQVAAELLLAHFDVAPPKLSGGQLAK